MDELDPELPEEKEGEQWQCTTNFQRDHDRVKRLLKNVWSSSQRSSDGSAVIGEHAKMLEVFLGYVAKLEARTNKKGRRLKKRQQGLLWQ